MDYIKESELIITNTQSKLLYAIYKNLEKLNKRVDKLIEIIEQPKVEAAPQEIFAEKPKKTTKKKGE